MFLRHQILKIIYFSRCTTTMPHGSHQNTSHSMFYAQHISHFFTTSPQPSLHPVASLQMSKWPGCESGAMSVLLWCYKGLKYRVFLLPDDMNKNIPGQTKYPSNYLVMDWSWFLSTFLHNSCILSIKWDGFLIGQIDVTEDGWRRNILTLLAPPLLIAS